jgi:septation ring formation regulator EzrA
LISFKEFHIVIKQIIEENLFNIEEYQDKYYFKKKVQEYFPRISDEYIFTAIDSFNKDDYRNLHRQRSLQGLSEKLYTGVLKYNEGRIT